MEKILVSTLLNYMSNHHKISVSHPEIILVSYYEKILAPTL